MKVFIKFSGTAGWLLPHPYDKSGFLDLISDLMGAFAGLGGLTGSLDVGSRIPSLISFDSSSIGTFTGSATKSLFSVAVETIPSPVYS